MALRHLTNRTTHFHLNPVGVKIHDAEGEMFAVFSFGADGRVLETSSVL